MDSTPFLPLKAPLIPAINFMYMHIVTHVMLIYFFFYICGGTCITKIQKKILRRKKIILVDKGIVSFLGFFPPKVNVTQL